MDAPVKEAPSAAMEIVPFDPLGPGVVDPKPPSAPFPPVLEIEPLRVIVVAPREMLPPSPPAVSWTPPARPFPPLLVSAEFEFRLSDPAATREMSKPSVPSSTTPPVPPDMPFLEMLVSKLRKLCESNAKPLLPEIVTVAPLAILMLEKLKML